MVEWTVLKHVTNETMLEVRKIIVNYRNMANPLKYWLDESWAYWTGEWFRSRR